MYINMLSIYIYIYILPVAGLLLLTLFVVWFWGMFNHHSLFFKSPAWYHSLEIETINCLQLVKIFYVHGLYLVYIISYKLDKPRMSMTIKTSLRLWVIQVLNTLPTIRVCFAAPHFWTSPKWPQGWELRHQWSTNLLLTTPGYRRSWVPNFLQIYNQDWPK